MRHFILFDIRCLALTHHTIQYVTFVVSLFGCARLNAHTHTLLWGFFCWCRRRRQHMVWCYSGEDRTKWIAAYFLRVPVYQCEQHRHCSSLDSIIILYCISSELGIMVSWVATTRNEHCSNCIFGFLWFFPDSDAGLTMECSHAGLFTNRTISTIPDMDWICLFG